MKKIPYGESDFRKIKLENFYYIDKTHFIPKIEMMPSFLFFIRPRRFGKSLFLNMLAFYYDKYYENEFEEIFQETYILKNRTKEANSYHILKFDFSAVSTKGSIDDNFSFICNKDMHSFIRKYKLNIEINIDYPAYYNLKTIFEEAKSLSISIYVMDNFINSLLMHSQSGYKKLVSSKDEAIYKKFFKLLKIETNISNEYLFNETVGAKEELQKIIDYYRSIDNIAIKRFCRKLEI